MTFGGSARCSELATESVFRLAALAAVLTAAAAVLWARVAVDQDASRGRKKTGSEDLAALYAGRTPESEVKKDK